MNEIISLGQPAQELIEALKDPQARQELINILLLCGAASFALLLSLIGTGIYLYKKNSPSVDTQLAASEGMAATQAAQMAKDIKKTVAQSPSSTRLLK